MIDNPFQLINDLLFFKKESALNEDDLQCFVPFMVNRYASMYSHDMCEYINAVLNNKTLIGNFTPMELYNIYYNIIPKVKYKKIQYIKKAKKEKSLTLKEEELQNKLKSIAKNMDLSFNEVKILYNRALEFYDTRAK